MRDNHASALEPVGDGVPMKGRAVPTDASEGLRKRHLSLIPRAGAPSGDEVFFDEAEAVERQAEVLDPELRKAVVGE